MAELHTTWPQVLYYDGQFDDARVNVSLACTAAAAGAATVNHFECKALIKVLNFEATFFVCIQPGTKLCACL